MSSRPTEFTPASGDLSRGEAVIRGLVTLTGRTDAALEARVRELLRVGLQRFDLDVGVLGRVTGSTYTVIASVSVPGSHFVVRERAQLKDALCQITLERDTPTAFVRSDSEVAPLHLGQELESYLGIPIHVGAVLYGTLSFIGTRRPLAFDEVDRDSLELLAAWLSSELRLERIDGELVQAQKKLRGFVRMDPLTELLNRDAVLRVFERYAERAGFTGDSLACLVIGIDELQNVNEDFGDATGDRVIRAVGSRIRDCLRPSDVAGRIGNDEFLAILPEATLDDAATVAERISKSMELLIVKAREEAFNVTVSIAVSRVPLGRTNVAEVLAETEVLLGQSRAAGGGRIGVNTKVG